MLRPIIFTTFLMLTVTSCTPSLLVNNPSETAIFQSISIGNEGKARIDNVSIKYGNYPLIRGPAQASYSPRHGDYFSQTLVAVIPVKTEVYWESSDNMSHSVVIPTSNLATNHPNFYGFQFLFHDNYIDVFISEKLPRPDPYIYTKETKVYSSFKEDMNVQY